MKRGHRPCQVTNVVLHFRQQVARVFIYFFSLVIEIFFFSIQTFSNLKLNEFHGLKKIRTSATVCTLLKQKNIKYVSGRLNKVL